MPATIQEFTAPADPQLIRALQAMAQTEGRQLQTLVDEALREYVARRQGAAPRRQVMAALDDSMAQYDDVYRKLAK